MNHQIDTPQTNLRSIVRKLKYHGHRSLRATRPGGYARVRGDSYTIHVAAYGLIIEGDRGAALRALREAGIELQEVAG